MLRANAPLSLMLADQASNVENLHQRAKLLPSGYHTLSSFPKNLELFPALFAFLVVNLHCADSNRFAYPRHDGVEGPLGPGFLRGRQSQL
jgi:hypothetical protein